MIDKNLRILQVNLNRSAQATESALQVAVELAIDLIVVQEPWLVPSQQTPLDYTDTRSVNHPSFVQTFPTLPHPALRPRVLIYASRSLQAQINPLQDSPADPDCQAVGIKSTHFNFTLYNIYNENDQQGSPNRTIERMLLPTMLPTTTLVLGDFNTHHPWWDPLAPTTSPGADRFLEWIEAQHLELLNTPGTGTFFRPNMSRESVLDLSFATQDLAGKIEDWQVVPGLGSDHHGILFAIEAPASHCNDPAAQPPRFNTSKADWDLFATELASAIAGSLTLSNLSSIPSPSAEDSMSLLKGENRILEQQLDELGEELTSAIVQAATASIPYIKLGPKPKPWWNQDLHSLRKSMLHNQRTFQLELARTSPAEAFLWKRDYLLARNAYFHAIKAAKRDHWNQFLEKEDPKSIFKAMAYTKNSPSQRIPPIQASNATPAILEDSFTGKCSAFRNTLFPPPPVTDSISWDHYQEGRWEWPALSRAEVETACSSKVQSSTPGPDAINQEIITAAYQAQPDILFKVFSLFFDHGYHPVCWKQATGIILKKPGKPDYSAPKAYRVIALLNCLGKVVERLLAKRLGALAEVTSLLHSSQIGGRVQKSAIDASLCEE